jgi:hypothetical protein
VRLRTGFVLVVGAALVGVLLSVYFADQVRQELRDISSVVVGGEEAVLIGDGTASWHYPALLFVTCVNAAPSRLIASWRMAEYDPNVERPGSLRGKATLSAYRRVPRERAGLEIGSGLELRTGMLRQLLVTSQLSAAEIDGISATLEQSDRTHSFSATERGFRFVVTEEGRSGLHDACAGNALAKRQQVAAE